MPAITNPDSSMIRIAAVGDSITQGMQHGGKVTDMTWPN